MSSLEKGREIIASVNDVASRIRSAHGYFGLQLCRIYLAWIWENSLQWLIASGLGHDQIYQNIEALQDIFTHYAARADWEPAEKDKQDWFVVELGRWLCVAIERIEVHYAQRAEGHIKPQVLKEHSPRARLDPVKDRKLKDNRSRKRAQFVLDLVIEMETLRDDDSVGLVPDTYESLKKAKKYQRLFNVAEVYAQKTGDKNPLLRLHEIGELAPVARQMVAAVTCTALDTIRKDCNKFYKRLKRVVQA